MKALVAYFSAQGTTAALAKALAELSQRAAYLKVLGSYPIAVY